MCASTNQDEAYIYFQRCRGGVRRLLVPAVTSQIRWDHSLCISSSFCISFHSCLNDVCSRLQCFVSLSYYFPVLSTNHHGSCYQHSCQRVQDMRWERRILQHSEQRWIPKPGDLSAAQLCQGKWQKSFFCFTCWPSANLGLAIAVCLYVMLICCDALVLFEMYFAVLVLWVPTCIKCTI